MGETLLVVEVLGEPERVSRRSWRPIHAPGRSSTRTGPSSFGFEGDAEAASELLTGWSRQGVRVASFVRRKDNLEDLFLKVGSRELS